MNMNQWLKDCLTRPNQPLPVLSFPGIQLIGVSVRDLVSSGTLQARCMKAIADRYPSLAAVSNMDLSVEAEAFGATALYTDDEVPGIAGRLVETAEVVAKQPIPAVGAGRTGEYVQAITLAAKLITDRPVLAGVIGPFSLAGRLMEMAEIMYQSMDEPETVHALLDKVTVFLIRYILAFKEAGANGIVLAEPAAGLLSPDWNATFSANYVRRIVDAVQDDAFVVFYHNCGNVVPLIPAIVATGAHAFHFGNAIDLADVMDQIPDDHLMMGNIDPVTQFVGGTPETVFAATTALLEEMRGRRNFVLSSGCDIPPHASLANIDAFFAAAAAFNAKRV